MAKLLGRAPGPGSGETSRRTKALRPPIALDKEQAAKARKLRRAGAEPAEIAKTMGVPVKEVEKALVQMRSPRPETTRGTLNVTIAAHRLITSERRGHEPIYETVDRFGEELLRRRAVDADLLDAVKGLLAFIEINGLKMDPATLYIVQQAVARAEGLSK